MIELPFIHRNKHLKTAKEVVDAAVQKLRDEKIPNPLYSNFEEDSRGLFVPQRQEVDVLDFGGSTPVSYKFSFAVAPPTRYRFRFIDDVDPFPLPEPELEVNLMEALIGWRSWEVFSGRGKLISPSLQTEWTPNKPLEATCRSSGASVFDPAGVRGPCGKSPAENCGCGIYASSRREVEKGYMEDDNHVLGEVYGWGRYIRGDIGWRAQYAYPKCFYLKANQMNHVDFLRTFHVPIYIEQPIKIYNPEEDGYEHRNDEAHGYFGAGEVTDAGEEDCASADD